MSEEIKNRRLTIKDLYEFVEGNNISLDSVIFMRPKDHELSLVNRIGSGSCTDDSTGINFKIILLDGLFSSPMNKGKVH